MESTCGATGTKLTLLGQTNMWIKFKNIKKTKEIVALVCKEESDESLIDLDSLQVMGIIYKDFPLPIDRDLRESPEKVRLVNKEEKRNPTKLVDILER